MFTSEDIATGSMPEPAVIVPAPGGEIIVCELPVALPVFVGAEVVKFPAVILVVIVRPTVLTPTPATLATIK